MIDIKTILTEGGQSSRMIDATEYSNTIKRHTKGGRLLEKYLSQINEYENAAQFKLRQKFAISNKFVTSKLLRPADNLWRSKGGSTKTDIPETFEKQFAVEIAGVSKYMRSEWFDAFINDPNGVSLVVNSDKQFDEKEGRGILNYKFIPSENIIEILFSGDTIIEILILTGVEIKDETQIEKYLYISDEQIGTYEKRGDDVFEIELKTNPLKRVPAVVNSTLKTIEKEIYISEIDNEIELLNSFVRKNSVKEIFEFLHGFPKFWQYVEPCDVCNGTKQVEHEHGNGSMGYSVCPKCNGIGHFGKTDVADVLNIAMPETGDETIANQPMGFEIPPVDTWEQMRFELDWLWDIIFNSQWGTTVIKGQNETATGRFIDVQPVVNKLNEYADQMQRVFNELGDLVGRIIAPNTFNGFYHVIGRNFIIETPAAALERYETARGNGSNVNVLNHLLEQYYLSEFANNDNQFRIKTKLINVEPFPHNTVAEVLEFANDDDKRAKLFYSKWLSETDYSELLENSVEKLRGELYTNAPELDKQPEPKMATE